ncbi:hypothetical protein C8J55DRAFT_286787 [Lentinula edodes]|uniref:Uncharacterized protein n=1 Tax=Lentinula lateritia TaxID=40482 RepID=A0A9W8ZRK2_9AGAR|nr:hypothetical protein C8J55DRAFT_286787 [Lentinula edodes]
MYKGSLSGTSMVNIHRILSLVMVRSRKRNIVQFRVINTFKSMLTDEDILEKDDSYILARMKEFVLSEDVAQVIASRSLLALIERVQKFGETKRIVVKAAQTSPVLHLSYQGFSLISSNLSSMANMGSSSAGPSFSLLFSFLWETQSRLRAFFSQKA